MANLSAQIERNIVDLTFKAFYDVFFSHDFAVDKTRYEHGIFFLFFINHFLVLFFPAHPTIETVIVCPWQMLIDAIFIGNR